MAASMLVSALPGAPKRRRWNAELKEIYMMLDVREMLKNGPSNAEGNAVWDTLHRGSPME